MCPRCAFSLTSLSDLKRHSCQVDPSEMDPKSRPQMWTASANLLLLSLVMYLAQINETNADIRRRNEKTARLRAREPSRQQAGRSRGRQTSGSDGPVRPDCRPTRPSWEELQSRDANYLPSRPTLTQLSCASVASEPLRRVSCSLGAARQICASWPQFAGCSPKKLKSHHGCLYVNFARQLPFAGPSWRRSTI